MAEKYLFDTDAISQIFKPRPNAGFLKKFRVLLPEQVHISSVTIGEIVFGAFKCGNPQKYLDALDNSVFPYVSVLDLSSDVAFFYGKTRAELELAGTRLAEADLFIAATAIAHGCVLVSGNSRHFGRIEGLTYENWLA